MRKFCYLLVESKLSEHDACQNLYRILVGIVHIDTEVNLGIGCVVDLDALNTLHSRLGSLSLTAGAESLYGFGCQLCTDMNIHAVAFEVAFRYSRLGFSKWFATNSQIGSTVLVANIHLFAALDAQLVERFNNL